MRRKMRRMMGCRRRGRGWKSNRSGARGGVGRAGLWDHKISSRILAQHAVVRRVVNIRDLESKIEGLCAKGWVRDTPEAYEFTCGKFCAAYGKILGVGEPSKRYRFCRHMTLSKTALLKSE